MNSRGTHRRLGYRGDKRVPYARAGWNDALAGRAMDYSLIDSAERPALAHAYETARLRVLTLLALGHHVPKWGATSRVSPNIHAAITAANHANAAARADNLAFWPT